MSNLNFDSPSGGTLDGVNNFRNPAQQNYGRLRPTLIPLFESDVDDGDGIKLLEVARVGLVFLQDVAADLKILEDCELRSILRSFHLLKKIL